MLSSVRIGMWKLAVSIAHRKRKNRYCNSIGWVARKFGPDDWVSCTLSGTLEVEAVPLVRLLRLDGNGGSGGGGESGREGEDGVAFSIRAHVR